MATWGGDLTGYFAEGWFLGVDTPATALIGMALIITGTVMALRRAPRDMRWVLGAVIGFGILATLYFRSREFGYYFHFKTLAFVAPIVVVLAVAGLARFRRAWVATLAIGFVVLVARDSASHEIAGVFDQLSPTMLELKQVDKALPNNASLRLDMNPTGGCCGPATCSPASGCARSGRC